VETEWRSCPVAGIGIRGVESSGCVTKELDASEEDGL
jgi:hypothetical protein